MAKAGFWLRGAKGKLAGASMQKGANGQTIMREVVTPRNPKTNSQVYQRAIMATVMKLASAGSSIFDHSFQGVEKGQKCIREFIKENVKVLRASIAHNIDEPTAGGLIGACVGPKTGSFIAIDGGVISKGTYDVPVSFEDGILLGYTNTDNPEQYYATNGLVPGDIYTIVCIWKSKNSTTEFVVRGHDPGTESGFEQYSSMFGFVRLQVKPIPASLANLTYGSVFEVTDHVGLVNPQLITAADPEKIYLRFEGLEELIFGSAESSMLPNGRNDKLLALGVIRSRFDEDLRSNSTMNLTTDIFDGDSIPFGIRTPYILEAWKQGTEKIGDSDLILEGGDTRL